MPRNQVIYNVQDLFIGPCPASGYHFINYSGLLNNTSDDIPQEYTTFQYTSPNPAIIHSPMPIDKNENIFPRNHNLLKRIDRVQDLSYEIQTERTIINQIGKAASVDRIHLNKPQISFSFSYLLSSLRNEARMGFNVNYPRTDYPYTGDKYFYRTDNGDPLFLFSGFLNRDYAKDYPLVVNRGEGVDPIESPCFESIQPSPSPNPNFVSNNVPFWVGKNLNPILEFVNTETIDVAAGFYHSFVLMESGRLTGWGDNTEGQITNAINLNDLNGEFTGNWNNTEVGKLSGVKKISTNYLHNLAILSGDTITGWGSNEEGQAVGTTGFNDINDLFTGDWTSAPISSITGASGISAGAYHSLVLLVNKTITGWGDNNSGQALGGNNLTGVIGISAGGYHSLAILDINSGTITGWGDNDYGQTTSGNFLTGVKMISAGHFHSFALLHNGKVTGWGWNDDGQVAGTLSGNNISGVFTGNWLDTPVGKLTGVKSIHAGWFHTLALLENKTVTGWGFNNVGQLTENINYNNSAGIFTGDWNSTIVGSFQDVFIIDTSYQTSLGLLKSNPKEITGWGEEDVNYDLINNQLITDVSMYTEYDCITKDPYWPLTTKDKRNFFIAISEQNDDHNEKLFEDFSTPDDQTFRATNAHRRSKTTRTIGIGNCYLTSYSQTASVGDFIRAQVNYLGENMLFHMSGSGVNTPYVDPKTYETNTGIKFNIPSELDSKNPVSALQPGDLSISINSSGYGLNLSDIKIQSYEFSFNFERENLNAISYKLPLDREIIFPLIVNISFELIVGDQQYDDLAALIKDDGDHNILISCNNYCDYDPNFIWTPQNQSSEFEKRFKNIFNYEFYNCKFDGISYADQIGTRKTATFNFSTEIDIEDYNRGMQMSGILGIEKIEDFILTEYSGNEYITITNAIQSELNGNYFQSNTYVWDKSGGIAYPNAGYSSIVRIASTWYIKNGGSTYYLSSSSANRPDLILSSSWSPSSPPTITYVSGYDGNYLLQEDNDLLVSNLQVLY